MGLQQLDLQPATRLQATGWCCAAGPRITAHEKVSPPCEVQHCTILTYMAMIWGSGTMEVAKVARHHTQVDASQLGSACFCFTLSVLCEGQIVCRQC